MKIFLSGPHYSGKTTLAEFLADKHLLIGRFGSRPTLAAKKYFGLNSSSEVPGGSREVFQALSFAEQVVLEGENRAFRSTLQMDSICDRTAVDFAAYTSDETVKTAILTYAKTEYSSNDTFVFLVKPLGDKPEDDGKRFLTDPNLLFEEFVRLYNIINIPFHIVEIDTVENRAKFIEKIVGYK